MIGTYHEIAWQTPGGPLYHDEPIYGLRPCEPTPIDGMVQILIFTFGRWAWINGRLTDVRLTKTVC